MERVLTSFNLTNKITASVTDNGSNVQAASSQIRLFGVRFHCLAHALNLTIHNGVHLWPKNKSTRKQTGNNSLDTSEFSLQFSSKFFSFSTSQSIDSSASSSMDTDDDNEENHPLSLFEVYDVTVLMEKCRTIIATIQKSSILSKIVHTLAVDQSINARLIIDMRVRWNSSYRMLQRILLCQVVLDKLYEQLDSLPGVTNRQRKKLVNSKINGNDWNLIQALRRVLERFDEATKVLSGRNYPTLSLSYAIINSLLHYLNDRSDDTTENKIKDLLVNAFNKYMIRDGKEMAFIRVSVLLDPLVHDLLKPEDKRAAEVFITKEVIINFFVRGMIPVFLMCKFGSIKKD